MQKAKKIVLIMTDTQGANVVGCYGNPEMKTPNIDRLAGQGLMFERAYTASPVCGPARAAIFTGSYPHTAGSWGNNIPLGLNIKTIGERLSDNGFHTAYIGKWHLDGFDYFGTGNCPHGWDSKYWYDMRCFLEEYPEEIRQLSRNLDTPDKIHKHKITEEFTYAHKCSNRAIDFLSKTDDEDFLMVVSYDEPHGPSTCPPPYCDMYENYEYPLPENAFDSLENKPEHQMEWAATVKHDPKQKFLNRSMYFGCNSYVDYEIGRVVDAIDKYAPDALVIYTSDHGTPLLSHGLNSKGPAMYDETTKIPLIVRWPGETPEKSTCSFPVSHIDLTPTILDAANLNVPDFLEGKSMLNTFKNPETKPNDAVFIEFNRYEVDHDSWGGFQPIRCAFDGKYKLVINLHYTDELYDLKNDPGEMKNLINSETHSVIRDFLHDKILNWMAQTRDPFRGPVWERRLWRKELNQKWSGETRQRPDDGYDPPPLDYSTGLEAENRSSN